MTPDAYRSTLDHLYSLRRFGMRPGLGVMQGLLEGLEHPERSFHAIHIAGSKGKGSVAAMAAALLTATGEHVGLFTSPHLVSFRERIQADRRPIPKSQVVEGVERISALATSLVRSGRLERAPTFFEITTALAFDWFRTRKIRHAVIEVGLGGRLDSTNVIQAPIGIITTIELEHTDILGPTLTDIAREKAGILHPGMRALVGAVPATPLAEIRRVASAAGVPLEFLETDLQVGERTLDPRGQTVTIRTPRSTYGDLRIPLHGIFQPSNAALALAAVEEYARARDLPFDPEAARRALSKVRWRGRLERVARRPEVFVDVAHTPESTRAVAQSLAEIYPFLDPAENVVLFGCLSDKRPGLILESLAPLAQTLIVVPVGSERGMPVEDLRRAGMGRFSKVVQAPNPAAGLALARAATGTEGFTLAIGSDYLVGELLRTIEGADGDEPDLSDPISIAGAAASTK